MITFVTDRETDGAEFKGPNASPKSCVRVFGTLIQNRVFVKSVLQHTNRPKSTKKATNTSFLIYVQFAHLQPAFVMPKIVGCKCSNLLLNLSVRLSMRMEPHHYIRKCINKQRSFIKYNNFQIRKISNPHPLRQYLASQPCCSFPSGWTLNEKLQILILKRGFCMEIWCFIGKI